MEEVTTLSVITRITYLMFLFLILAIFVERTAEVFVSIVKYADFKVGGYKYWNRQAEKLKIRLDRLYRNQGSDAEDKKLLYKWILWRFVSDKPYIGGKEVIAAKSIRTHNYRIISRVFAFLLSLLFSVWVYQKYKLDLVAILVNVGNLNESLSVKTPVIIKILITAGIMTAGSEPMHQLFVRVENIGKSKKK
jgi:hypothetical protein